MTRLYLLRHGIAYPHGTPEFAEDDRPLTPKGQKRMRQIAFGLKNLKLKLDRIVTSPLPRARQTAEIVADYFEMPHLLESADVLAKPGAGAIREWLLTRGEANLMLVGHEPTLSQLVGLLTTGEPGRSVCLLKKGGIAALRDDPTTGFQLEWLATPRLIRRLSNY